MCLSLLISEKKHHVNQEFSPVLWIEVSVYSSTSVGSSGWKLAEEKGCRQDEG